MEDYQFTDRDRLSAILMDTSIDNPMYVDIVVSTNEDMGLGGNDKLRVVKIWQHPTEGWIDFKFDGSDIAFDIDDYPEIIPQILDWFKEVKNWHVI